MSGTYAEPGSQTFRPERNGGQFIAECRHCRRDIVLHSNASGAEWRHLDTADTRCGLRAEPVEDVA
jgi:hypothetical protein